MSDGKYLKINQGFTDLTGYEADEVIGRPSDSAGLQIWSDDTDRQRLVGELAAHGEVKNFCAEFRCRDGRIKTASMNAKIIEIEGEACILSITRDISGQRATEDDLRRERALLATIMETSPVGITTVDADGSITYANGRAEQILGLTRDEITSRRYNAPLWNATDLDGTDLPDEKQPFFMARTSGKSVYNVQHGISWPNGRHVILAVNASPMKDESGGFGGIVATFEDITEQKRVEAAITQQLEEKEILLKEVHHRIKNNIATIGSMLRMQADSSGSGESKSVLNDAISRVESMRVIYDKMLLAENFSETSVRDYLDDLLDAIISIFPEKSSIVLRKNIVNVVLPVKTLFLLGIIVNELITNSMKYGFVNHQEGIIGVSLVEDADQFCLTVHDNGRGLPDDFNRDISGSFGLMLVRMLSDQLQGTLSIENDNGAKCVVCFSLQEAL
jgi:PAS domain S-box-containing protein